MQGVEVLKTVLEAGEASASPRASSMSGQIRTESAVVVKEFLSCQFLC